MQENSWTFKASAARQMMRERNLSATPWAMNEAHKNAEEWLRNFDLYSNGLCRYQKEKNETVKANMAPRLKAQLARLVELDKDVDHFLGYARLQDKTKENSQSITTELPKDEMPVILRSIEEVVDMKQDKVINEQGIVEVPKPNPDGPPINLKPSRQQRRAQNRAFAKQIRATKDADGAPGPRGQHEHRGGLAGDTEIGRGIERLSIRDAGPSHTEPPPSLVPDDRDDGMDLDPLGASSGADAHNP